MSLLTGAHLQQEPTYRHLLNMRNIKKNFFEATICYTMPNMLIQPYMIEPETDSEDFVFLRTKTKKANTDLLLASS